MSAAKKKTAAPQTIELPALDIQQMKITLIGDSPLICHAWSEKAKRAMLEKQMKKATPRKEAKDPKADYQESLYKMPGGKYGFPAAAFKSALVSACRFVEGIPMTVLRGAVHVIGEMVQVDGAPAMREDMVRVGMGTADIRFRGEFKKWKAVLNVQFNARVLSPEQIANLFNTAGFGVGVGEWRPERNGSYGRFHVASSKEVSQ
jgi:hypothetical protein